MNGANGISLLIVRLFLDKFNFSRAKIDKLTAAPIQNDKTIAKIPPEKPKSQPTPRASLASPKPIHFPEETSHKKAKKENRIGPDNKSKRAGK